MLEFFRRHQRFFFVIITIVIVISFSFFGTYSALSDSPFREQVAFKAIDGTSVTRHELDEMAVFIGTDSTDKVLFGGMWGPNFLNDGVISKDFLQTGLGTILATSYPEDIRPDLLARLEKEKRYALYVHPQAGFIGTEAAWKYFSPEMASYYHAMKSIQDPLAPQSFQVRAALFLKEKQFPQSTLRQLLRYQEQQSGWVAADRNLDRLDLSLFGYHTLEDWFGSRFVRLASEFIMNAAKMAEERGYQVTRADALADLIRNAELSFQQNAKSPNLGVANSKEYFNEQLRRLSLDQNSAADIWRQIMLFRVFFQDMGGSVFVDSHTFRTLDNYAFETVEGELFQLPKEVRLKDFKALQKFEVYLDAISNRSENEKTKLTLPTTFLTAAQVAKTMPELVQKRYTLEIAQVNKKHLEGNVGVKDSWNWEVSDKGWTKLKKQFPELGAQKGETREERFAALDSLDTKTRARVDAFSRSAVVDEHPEWLAQALAEAPGKKESISLHEKGKNTFFSGLEDGKSLMLLLDAAPLAGQESSGDSAKKAADKLANYSADQITYYQIKVIDRSGQPEILTFKEADEEGVLDSLLDKQLKISYEKIRESDPKVFQKDDGSWKLFADVKEAVAERYFDQVLNAIRKNYAEAIAPEKAPEKMIPDYAATLRLFSYVKEMQTRIRKDPTQKAVAARDVMASQPVNLAARASLAEQWKLERTLHQVSRSSADTTLDQRTLFALSPGDWTKVNTPANGNLNFFFVMQKSEKAEDKQVDKSVAAAKKIVSNDAQQQLMRNLLQTIQEKNAISLDYLKQVAEIDQMNIEELRED